MNKQIGTDELPTNSSSTSMEILELFKSHPKTYYTQAELVITWKKSNPAINKLLRKLLEQGVVGRTKVGSKYYYKLK